MLCLAALRVRDRPSSKENTSVFLVYCSLRFAVGISNDGPRKNVVLRLAAFRVRDRPSSKKNTSVFYCSLRFAVGISKP